MVRDQIIEARGVSDRRVLDAMRAVPRHLFVARPWAYRDHPLAIDGDLCVSHPSGW